MNQVSSLEQELQIIEQSVKNPAAFAPLYEKYFKQIYLFIFKRCADEELAEDLTSQTFMKAIKNLSQYNYQGVPFSAWLYRIARNELLLHYRSEKYKRAVYANLADFETIFDEFKESDERDHRASEMKRALAHLSEDDLTLIEMKYFEHRQYDEIADILGITVSNAKVKVHRIVKKLQKLVVK